MRQDHEDLNSPPPLDDTGNPDPAVGEELYDNPLGATESSPQRPALLLLLVIILGGGGALYFMRLRTATAAAASPQAAQAQTAINQFLTEGDRNLAQMRDLLRSTEKVVEQFLAYPSVKQVGADQLRLNPFLIPKARAVETAQDDAGARARAAALAREKEEAARAAAALQLQSILWSDTNAVCMISGRAYGVGQTVGGFLIEKIDRGAVTVRRGDYRFQLAMQQR
jgi:hypothetical protein